MTQVEKQLIRSINQLTDEQRLQVLDFVMRLQSKTPPGVSGEEFVRRVNELDFPKEDLEEIRRAIEEGCEQIDRDGW